MPMPPTNGSVVVVVSGEDQTGEVFNQIQEHLRRTTERAEEANSSLSEFGEILKRHLEWMGVGFGTYEAVDFFKETIKGSVELAEQLKHLSAQTGISTADLSVLKVMADQTGVDFDILAKGFKKFSTFLFEYQMGSKQAVEGAKLLGISQKDLSSANGDLLKSFGMISDKMEKLPDGWKKNAAATQMFGRAGVELIPIMNQGSAAIEIYRKNAEMFGMVLDEQGIAKLEEMHWAMAGLRDAEQGVEVAFTEGLSRAITGTAEALAGNVKGMAAWESMGRSMGNVVAWLAETFTAYAYDARMAKDELASWVQAAFSVEDLVLSKTAPTAAGRDYYRQALKEDQAAMKSAAEDHLAAQKAHDDMIATMEKMRHELSKPISAADLYHPKGPGGPKGPGQKERGLGTDEESRRIDEEARRELDAMEKADRDQLRLAESQDSALEARAKSHAAVELAQLDAQYAGMKERDQAYYDRKAAIQKEELDAEQTALAAQIRRITAEKNTVEGKQREAELDEQILRLQTQLAELGDRRKIDEAQIAGEIARQQAEQQRQAAEAAQRLDKSQLADTREAARQGQRYADALFDPLLSANKNFAEEMRRSVEGVMKDLARDQMHRMIAGMFGLGAKPGAAGLPGMGGDIMPAPANGGVLAGIGKVFGMGGSAGGSMPLVPAAAGAVAPSMLPGMRLGNSPNIAVQIVNNSSQPQQVTDVQAGQGTDPQQFVTSIVLDDLNRGGAISQAISGIAGLAMLA